jgi:integral membrane protein
VRGALIRYRVMAYVVGCLLIVLVCVGVPLKYLADNDTVVTWSGIPHGWLYMILIITAFDLGRRARWGWGRLILIALAGTVPFLSFVAEHYATKDVRAKLSVYPEYADQSSLPVEAAAVNARNASPVDRAPGPVDEKAAQAGRDNAPGPSSAD